MKIINGASKLLNNKKKPKWNRSHWGSDKMFANYSLFVSLSWWNNKNFELSSGNAMFFFIQNSIYLCVCKQNDRFFPVDSQQKSREHIFVPVCWFNRKSLFSWRNSNVNNGKICDNDDDKTYFTLWQWYKAPQPGFAPWMYGIWIQIQCCL